MADGTCIAVVSRGRERWFARELPHQAFPEPVPLPHRATSVAVRAIALIASGTTALKMCTLPVTVVGCFVGPNCVL